MKGEIGFALAGTGNIAVQHALAIGKLRNARLVAVASRDRKRAEEFAKRFSVDPYDDYDEMLRRKDIHAVDIVTCNKLHAEMGIKAANAKKHVIVEKPIDISLEKSEKLIRACKRNGVLLTVISQKRFDAAMQKLKGMLDSGKLGKVFLVNASVKWRRSNEYYMGAGGWKMDKACVGGGALLHQAIHFVDIMMWLLGPVDSVCGKKMTATHSMPVEDTIIGNLHFKCGALGCIESTTSVKCSMPDRFEIHGEKGSVVIERNRIVGWNFRKNPLISMGESRLRSLMPMRMGTIGDQISDFADAIRTKRKPKVRAEEARDVLKVALGIYESIEKRRDIKILSGG